jgi:hypothetical protein
MAGKLTDAEILLAAELRQDDLVANPPLLMLFTNNFTPDEATVLSDLTEATFPGYSRQTIDFSPAATITAHVAKLTPVAVVFTRAAGAGGDNVYGYGVLDSTGTVLLWAQKDPGAPIDMSIVGATYTVTAVRKTQSG